MNTNNFSLEKLKECYASVDSDYLINNINNEVSLHIVKQGTSLFLSTDNLECFSSSFEDNVLIEDSTYFDSVSMNNLSLKKIIELENPNSKPIAFISYDSGFVFSYDKETSSIIVKTLTEVISGIPHEEDFKAQHDIVTYQGTKKRDLFGNEIYTLDEAFVIRNHRDMREVPMLKSLNNYHGKNKDEFGSYIKQKFR